MQEQLPHLPLLRAGRPYRSLALETLTDVRTGEPVAQVSQATAGMISRDLREPETLRRPLDAFTVAELVEICGRAAALFLDAELPLDETAPASASRAQTTQSTQDYVHQLSSTTGMPHALARANMFKVAGVLQNMDAVLGGLTRGLDLSVLDAGWGEQDARKLSYLRLSETLGAVLPNNSPGVHTLWLPAIPLKVALVLKPGSTEPWTPLRVAQALYAAGCPREAISFYPADRSAGPMVLQRCGRSMMFGDAATVERFAKDPRVQPHGPGWSKVIFAPDAADAWDQHLDMLVESAAANGGRSCINASGVWLPTDPHKPGRRARALAEALAERLAVLEPRPLDDPDASLAAFANPAVAHAVDAMIEQQLQLDGAEDVTARLRREQGGDASRVAEIAGCTFLRPTVIRCDDPEHPLASAEFVFPFMTVVEVPEADLLQRIGSTLVGSVISDDPDFQRRALECPHIDRLNLGAIATAHIAWDQPHEGSLFEHLYRQRAFQAAGG